MKDLSELKEMFETKKVSKGVKDEIGSGEKKKHTERWSGVVVIITMRKCLDGVRFELLVITII